MNPTTTDPMRCVSAATRVARPTFAVGAHLTTPRLGYTHHGIYVGGDRVVHYAGLSRARLRGPVEVVSLAHFAGGRQVHAKPGPCARYAPEEVVRRALSRLGEDLYRISTNNCEHFCEWCRSGECRSEQVDRISRPLRAAALAAGRFVRIALLAGAMARPVASRC